MVDGLSRHRRSGAKQLHCSSKCAPSPNQKTTNQPSGRDDQHGEDGIQERDGLTIGIEFDVINQLDLNCVVPNRDQICTSNAVKRSDSVSEHRLLMRLERRRKEMAAVPQDSLWPRHKVARHDVQSGTVLGGKMKWTIRLDFFMSPEPTYGRRDKSV